MSLQRLVAALQPVLAASLASLRPPLNVTVMARYASTTTQQSQEASPLPGNLMRTCDLQFRSDMQSQSAETAAALALYLRYPPCLSESPLCVSTRLCMVLGADTCNSCGPEPDHPAAEVCCSANHMLHLEARHTWHIRQCGASPRCATTRSLNVLTSSAASTLPFARARCSSDEDFS